MSRRRRHGRSGGHGCSHATLAGAGSGQPGCGLLVDLVDRGVVENILHGSAPLLLRRDRASASRRLTLVSPPRRSWRQGAQLAPAPLKAVAVAAVVPGWSVVVVDRGAANDPRA